MGIFDALNDGRGRLAVANSFALQNISGNIAKLSDHGVQGHRYQLSRISFRSTGLTNSSPEA